MKKSFMLVFIFISASLNVLADEACYRTCKSDANQIGLQCQKMRQMCYKAGASDSLKFDLCMDEVADCLQSGKAEYEACMQSCEKEN